ncbi:MAG TPA: ATP-binding cassette domain-containing protein [Dehalococcoidales bacterium]|nr:ATP-binding cassette domain-containing protein [Dehalococcoidales bacterium]
MNEIIRVEGITKVYRMDEVEVPALRGVDLTVEHGDFFAIVGPSGCGKSTLLHLLGCLDKPTDGRVFFNGEDVSALGDGALTRIRSRHIGLIFQTFNLMPTLSARENVALQLRLAGIKGAQAARMAEEALEKVELTARMKHLPKQLSGGER